MKDLAPKRSSAAASRLVDSMRAGEIDDVFDAFWQLDSLPVDEVRDALAQWVGPLPDPERLDPATRRAHGMPPAPLRLRAISVARDADVLDLGSIAEEQLRVAGQSWDGADLAPEDRLDGELEGSFAGTLERWVVVDADGSSDVPLFDVMRFAGDSGVVFKAGTTTIVAMIAYGKVEMRDRRTREAIEAAVEAARGSKVESAPIDDAAIEDAEPEAAVEDDALEPAIATAPARAKKTAAKKTTAKKSAVKSAPAKKTAAKKTATKKTAAAKKAPAAPKKKSAAKTVKRAAKSARAPRSKK